MPRSTPSAPPSEAARLLALVDQLILEVQPGTPLRATLDSALDRDLGLDSLARVELLARVEATFGLRLANETVATALTPRQLLAALEAAGLQPAPAPAAQARQSAPERAEGRPEDQATLIEVLQWHVARHPDRPHVIFYRDEQSTDTLTYAQLAEAAGRIAAALAADGLRPGQCVALMLPSGLDFFRCFFGILFAGGIPVPMYPPARPAQLEDHLRRQAGILRNCQAPLLITSELVRPLARLLTGLAPDLRQVLLPAQLQAAAPRGAHPASADELALIQYTSGSTGDPKGVTLAHRNVLANIRAWGGAVALSSTDVCVSWLPLYHDMGLIVAWLGSLYHACPLVLMSPLDFLARPESWLWAIHRHRGTVAAAPNFAYDLCVRRLADKELSGLDLSSWRLAANGAEPVSPDTLGRFADCFARYGLRREILTPAYGLAEATVGLAVPPPGRGVQVDRVAREPFMTRGLAEPAAADDAQALRFVSCGPALPGHALRIVDDAGVPLAERQVGHLEFRGPSATAGYYRNEAASAGLLRGDWLETGDYAYLAGGEVHITGRSKDLIIRGGRNFYPYDLEQAVGELPGARRGCVAVFGIPATAGAGERLVVVAETRERDPTSRAALERRIVALAADQLGLPPDVVVLAPPHSVLKTSSGKIRRAAIREAFEQGTLGASARAPWLQVLHLAGASLPGRLRKGIDYLLARLYGAWAWGCCAVLAPPAALAILLLPNLSLRWTAIHRLLRLLARLCACPLSGAGLERQPHHPCVLVANHASYIDALLLVAVLPQPVGFVAKAEFKRQPLLRWLFERMGSHFVERGDALQSVEDVQTLAAQARGSAPLLIFAEGTIGAQPGLRPFRLGAFHIAVQRNLQVVPVALAGTRQVLPDGSWRPRRGPLAVTVCAPLAPTGADWHAALALREQARSAILAHCGEADLADTGQR
ncbi:AMP-binding protein [Pseudomonas sp. GCM10022188]|uniref:AMP-binding protein n=1 Tax=Pseudomonas TaxID=286 RepID=UPI001E463A47|nr:AMP-binding protein [Pseudomonas oryzagri]MCC6077416.1 AMP-binding protein [Pseudomonas oryzagri]